MGASAGRPFEKLTQARQSEAVLLSVRRALRADHVGERGDENGAALDGVEGDGVPAQVVVAAGTGGPEGQVEVSRPRRQVEDGVGTEIAQETDGAIGQP